MNMTKKKVTPPEFKELFQEIDDSFDVKDTNIRILVFGPDLDGDGVGSKLRKHIVNKCKEDKFVVVLAEHEEIQELYLKILDPIFDLCKMELHLAITVDKNHGQDIIDGIILLPDSGGSLVELGMFVLEDRIYSKILILFNKDYESTIHDSFIGKGAKLAFDNGRATTKIIDYNDFAEVWGEVSGFLKTIKSKKVWRLSNRRNKSYA